MSEVRTIAVIGAGTMGSGIALTAAMSGLRAYQVDVADITMKIHFAIFMEQIKIT